MHCQSNCVKSFRESLFEHVLMCNVLIFFAKGEAVTIHYLSNYYLHNRLIFPSGEGRDEEALARVCASWRKFLALTDLLEYSLTDVAEWLPRTLHFCLLFL